MKHAELVEKGCRWLRGRCHVVAAEVQTFGEIPDCIGWYSWAGKTTVIECKTSRSDFLKDAKKVFREIPSLGCGVERYYAAPKGMIKPGELPKDWGLLEPHGSSFKVVVKANAQEPNRTQEQQILIQVMRCLHSDWWTKLHHVTVKDLDRTELPSSKSA